MTTAAAVLDNRKKLTFPGDCRDALIGRIAGPTRLREYWTAVEVEYLDQQDTTIARFLPTTQLDIDALDPTQPNRMPRTTRLDQPR